MSFPDRTSIRSGKQQGRVKGRLCDRDCEGTPDAILIASGSEVDLAVKAKAELTAEGKKIRVVSMPCMDIFEEQSAEYKESVLPKEVRRRIVVEALSDFGWGKYVGLDGAYVTMKSFGASRAGSKTVREVRIYGRERCKYCKDPVLIR